MVVRIALLAAVLAWAAITAGASAQTPTETPDPGATPPAAPAQDRGRALIILDGSKSMNEDAGDGGTRLDAAKAATLELLGSIPPTTELGLRIYGSKLAGVSREEACRDSELAFPVGPSDRGNLRDTVEGLRGTGRTPIGRSLLAAPDDLGSEGKRVVVLVSDGGDNCAPPDPCEAAEEVSRRGLDLTVSVVGLQVSSDRVRRQLECIARAGGGTYVGVEDAEQLGAQLRALFARALRRYEPAGEPAQGTPEPDGAPQLAPGRYLDEVADGESRHYVVEVPEGNRLVVASTFVKRLGSDGQGEVRTEVLREDGQELEVSSEALGVTGGINRVNTAAVTGVPAGSDEEWPPGRYVVRLSVDGNGADPFTEPLPVELGIDVAPIDDPVDFAGEPFRPGGDGGGAEASDDGDGGGGGLLIALGVALVALVLSLVVTLVLVPRRTA